VAFERIIRTPLGYLIDSITGVDGETEAAGAGQSRDSRVGSTGNYTYVGKDATVILSKDGKVITARVISRDGWRNP
jgi:hypothetical protein